MTMFHVISDIVLSLLDVGKCLECEMLWPSVTGKMAGTGVIPDFLTHWHTSGKIMFSNMSAIYVLFSLRLKACKPNPMVWSFRTLMCSGLALEPCARSDAFSSCKWVPQLWVLLPLYMYYSTSMIPIEMSFQRCFGSDHHFWIAVRIWKSIGQVWKTSIWHLMEQLWYRK